MSWESWGGREEGGKLASGGGDAKARMLRMGFSSSKNLTFKLLITKGAENLASRSICPDLENTLMKTVNDPKEENESFPLETLNMVDLSWRF
ncbi:hypothetical protein Tco_0280684 [Tanacetum coccineum]